ncbi:RES family NAD+ phosphorylase [Sorangium sp. So ce1097]|uniref:RES family NAD+ phosphorylase n=1 Tax=Sorangium sp. So ce1097 TaxID=3133330 RepID=UPI003F6217AB
MKTTLGPHPDPPPGLAAMPLPVTIFRRCWFRIHRLAHAPLFFGRSGDNRFDAPAGEFGVLYAGKDAHCAFIEVFGHATGARLVEQGELAARGLARIAARRPLRLVNLAGGGLARLGADARLTSGESYAAAHRWALAIHDHPRRPDGIVYAARHDPSRVCAALFDRASADLEVTPLGSLADPAHAALLARVLDTYRFGLV